MVSSLPGASPEGVGPDPGEGLPGDPGLRGRGDVACAGEGARNGLAGGRPRPGGGGAGERQKAGPAAPAGDWAGDVRAGCAGAGASGGAELVGCPGRRIAGGIGDWATSRLRSGSGAGPGAGWTLRDGPGCFPAVGLGPCAPSGGSARTSGACDCQPGVWDRHPGHATCWIWKGCSARTPFVPPTEDAAPRLAARQAVQRCKEGVVPPQPASTACTAPSSSSASSRVVTR